MSSTVSPDAVEILMPVSVKALGQAWTSSETQFPPHNRSLHPAMSTNQEAKYRLIVTLTLHYDGIAIKKIACGENRMEARVAGSLCHGPFPSLKLGLPEQHVCSLILDFFERRSFFESVDVSTDLYTVIDCIIKEQKMDKM